MASGTVINSITEGAFDTAFANTTTVFHLGSLR
jgi:hypothetical protein